MTKIIFFNRYKDKRQCCYIDNKEFETHLLKYVFCHFDGYYFFPISTIKPKCIEAMIAKLCLRKTTDFMDVLYHNYHYLL